jgi:hypothetical protein
MDTAITRRSKLKICLFASVAAIITLIVTTVSNVYAAHPTVDLGTATPFAILAGTPNITDAGNASVIQGNVGLSPASGAGIGLTCAQVTGTIYSVDAAGPLPCRVTDAPLLTTAKNDLTTAYDDAAGRTPVTTVPTELGGTTLVDGTYDSASTTFEITAGAGPLVLDGQNDPSSVFIFNADFSGTGLTVGPGSTVSLINGAQACNVFWRVDTATIDTTADFKGTILALNSITVADGATIEGRLLARNGNVTLINDTITVPTCAATPDEDDDSDADTVVPGFPNSGFLSTNTAGWLVASASIVALIVLLAYVARKKRLI